MRTVQRFIRGTRGSAAPTVGAGAAAAEEEEMDVEGETPAEGSSGGTWLGSPRRDIEEMEIARKITSWGLGIAKRSGAQGVVPLLRRC